MPVILLQRDWAEWLDRDSVRPAPLHLLRPYDSEAMQLSPCNSAVGNVKNNGPDMLLSPEQSPRLPLNSAWSSPPCNPFAFRTLWALVVVVALAFLFVIPAGRGPWRARSLLAGVERIRFCCCCCCFSGLSFPQGICFCSWE